MDAPRCPSCDDLVGLLDEQLAPADLRRVSAHVAACPACQQALDGLTGDPDPSLPSVNGRTADPTPAPSPNFLDRLKHVTPPSAPPRPAPSTPDAGVAAAEAEDAGPPPRPEGYEVLGVLGRGGEGVVYKARHVPLGRVVALKMLRDGARAQAESLKRFQLEAETLARLRHPHIVQVFEVGEYDGRPFFAMEYVEGGPLSARLRGEPHPARDAARLVEALARAVHAAHEAGVLHRDLKPQNVLLAPGPGLGSPRVSDFGLAKRVQADPGLTRTGMVLGTPGYMAPEQARPDGRAAGPACDVYALGSILYHLLTGRPPFVGASPMDVLLQVVHAEPASLRRLFPQTPRDLETICLKCLQKDPRRRYPTAAALADDLGRYLDGRAVRARPTPWWERAWKAARRRPAAAALLAVSAAALLALAGGGLYYNARLAAALRDAEANARQARDAEGRAAREAADARAAEKRAADNAAEADRQRGLALEAYRKLIFEVQEAMAFKPGLYGLKQKLLKTAAQGLQEVARGAERAAPDRARAQAHYELGLVFAEISEDDEAERQFRLCRDVADEVARAGPFDPLAEDVYCQAGVALGDLYLQRRRLPEAIDCLRQTRERAEAWRAAAPDSPEARERLAECYTNLAAAHAQAGDFKEVEPWAGRLLALATKWEEDDPKSEPAHYFRYQAEEYRGRLCQAAGDPAAALESFRRAGVILKPLRDADPGSRRYALAELYLGKCFTSVLVQLGRPAQALPYARAAADYFRETRASEYNDPDNFEAQLECAEAYVVHSRVLTRLLRFDDAAQQLAAALDVLRPLGDKAKSEGAQARVRQCREQAEGFADYLKTAGRVVEDPSSALGLPAQSRQDLLLVRVCVLLNRGRVEDAAKAADLVDGLRWDGPDELLSLARTYAACIDLVAAEKEPDQVTDAEKAMRRRFADRAFDALGRACDGGFRDAPGLKADVGFVSLRGDPRFRALVERLERPR